MCGIAGLIDPALTADQLGDRAGRMADRLTHRGPDGSGVWVDQDASIALGHRRLAIIDLSSTGAQPMHSADGRFVLTYNGEIYNYRELRRELEGAGHRFRGGSDSEVLIEACAAWGVARAVERCAGMFAFALWDRRERRLSLVRDRLGIKPLYWMHADSRFLFGSELKALRIDATLRPEIDRAVLAAYLRYSYVPAPFTIYAGIQQLEPGTILTFTAGGAPILTRYWDAMQVARDGLADPLDLALEDATEQVDILLREVVRGHLIADVPVGALLSGGIDSSTLVALMQQESTAPVHSFSIGYSDRAFDEGAAARQVAAHLGTQHEELVLDPVAAQGVIPKLASFYDEPFADPSQIPTLVVSEMTRRRVSVVLSGDGGDEVFAGYNRHRVALSRRRLNHVPPFAGSLLRGISPAIWDRLGQLLPDRRRPRQLGDKLHKLTRAFGAADGSDLYRRLLTHWDPSILALDIGEPDCLPNASDFADPIAQMQALDMAFYLPNDILTKIDRASMSAGLEARVPYLDHRLIEFCWRLPTKFKLDQGIGKRILRRVLDRYVPAALVERPKMGFAVPLDEWLRGPLRDWAEALLAPERLRDDGLVAAAPVRALWSEHLAGRVNAADRLWSVLMLGAWHDRWIGSR